MGIKKPFCDKHLDDFDNAVTGTWRRAALFGAAVEFRTRMEWALAAGRGGDGATHGRS
jgi:hypothetical protein